jgi:hypothetical protein
MLNDSLTTAVAHSTCRDSLAGQSDLADVIEADDDVVAKAGQDSEDERA